MIDNNDKLVEEKYRELIEHAPHLEKHFKLSDMIYSSGCSDGTGKNLRDTWLANEEANIKQFPKYQLVKDACRGIGINKATILIGAGPSYNKYKRLLRDICYANAQYEFPFQPFILICSNHQLKPCLKEGIIPHFVILMDASDVVYDQLCKGIPKHARGVNLVTTFRADPNVLKEWKKQGRNILFFMLQSEFTINNLKKIFDDENLFERAIPPAGNVINQAWLVSIGYMGSVISMALGNDLSYDYHEDIEKRRQSYYADCDYSSNIGTGRDEAKRVISWMGFEHTESILEPGTWIRNMVPKATTHQLLVYKLWMESIIGLQTAQDKSFHYYNCSDGILGVISKKEPLELDKESFNDNTNWYFLDKLYPNRYHTRPFPVAINEFLAARSVLCQNVVKETLIDAGHTNVLI